MKSLLVFTVIFMFSFGENSFGQRGYTEKDTTDNVITSYRWQRSNIFLSDSRTVLNLRLTNNNEYPVDVKFAVGFYKSGVLKFDSEPVEKCFEPGQSMHGRRAGFRFESKDITVEDIESKNFDWSYSFFTVEEVEKCE